MENSERVPLLTKSSPNGLSLIFSIICIIDVFGVFPIIALPKPAIDCGSIGFLIVLTVCTLQTYTASLLGKCWLLAEDIDPNIASKNRHPYSALAVLTYGKTFGQFVTLLLNLTIFGAGIPNLIVASKNLELLGLRLSNSDFDFSYCFWIIIMGMVLCPFLWLGSPKDMKFLCAGSSFLVVLVFGFSLTGILTDNRLIPPATDINEASLWQNILSLYGILTFQYDIHPTILSIQVDMKNKKNVSKALFGGFAISLLTFFPIYIAAFYKYGQATRYSILETLPTTLELHFAAILVAVQLGFTSAIGNTALYQNVEDYLGVPRYFNYRRCVIRSLLVILSILIAETVPKFDLVMSLIGGTLTGPLVFIFPPLFYLKMLKLKRDYEEGLLLQCYNNILYKSSDTGTADKTRKFREVVFREQLSHVALQEVDLKRKLNVFLCYFLVVFGIFATFGTTVSNVFGTYVSFSPPCISKIMNVSLHFDL